MNKFSGILIFVLIVINIFYYYVFLVFNFNAFSITIKLPKDYIKKRSLLGLVKKVLKVIVIVSKQFIKKHCFTLF